MKKYASIKRRPKSEAKPSAGTISHNQRFVKSDDLLPEEFQLPNFHLVKISNATKTFQKWKEENEKRYKEKNGRKMRSDAYRLESLAIVLSGEQVAKCDPAEIWNNALEFKEWFEKRYKTTVRTMDWHRDEGHVNESGEVKRNDHIHVEFDNVNMDGKMVRRLFSRGDVIGFQDKIAEIYKPLGFVRGEDTAKKNRSDKPKFGLSQTAYKKKKIKSNIAKVADLKKINLEIRQKMQEEKAKAPAYRELEADMKVLKERVKNQELTISELENIAYLKTKKIVKIGKKRIVKIDKKSYKELYEKEKEKSTKTVANEAIAKEVVKIVEVEKEVIKFVEVENKEDKRDNKRYKTEIKKLLERAKKLLQTFRSKDFDFEIDIREQKKEQIVSSIDMKNDIKNQLLGSNPLM